MTFIKGQIPWNKNKPHKKETKEKIGISKNGSIPWNKDKRGVYTKETLKKMGAKNKGIRRSIATEIKKGQHISPKTEFKKGEMKEKQMGNRNSNYKNGKYIIKFCIDCKNKISAKLAKRCQKCHKKYAVGKNAPNWLNGKSFEPYGLEFNEDLKEVIRNRDRRKCQICEKIELEEGRKLSIHHIDYDKKNNNPNNLISLCYKCHTKTNHNRDNWINYFK